MQHNKEDILGAIELTKELFSERNQRLEAIALNSEKESRLINENLGLLVLGMPECPKNKMYLFPDEYFSEYQKGKYRSELIITVELI